MANMTDQTKLILIGTLALISIIIIIILILNTKKSSIRQGLSDLTIRYNAVKSIPLAFKLNNAQTIAKRNDDTVEVINEYYQKYEEVQKSIDEIGELIENAEDKLTLKDYKGVKGSFESISLLIDKTEEQVKNIDKFLEDYSAKENDQRENSARLKEEFRNIKLYVNEKSNLLSISNEGINKKIENVEDLFSQSEEFIYINDYTSSSDCLKKIATQIKELKKNIVELPELISDTKGVVPTMLDEVSRQYALTKQRGVYLGHLNIETKIENIQTLLQSDVRTLTNGDTTDVKRHNEEFKAELNSILNSLGVENDNYQSIKGKSDEIANNLNDLRTLFNYVKGSYDSDQKRFGIEDIGTYLDNMGSLIDIYQNDYVELNKDIASTSVPASELIGRIDDLLDKTNKDIKVLSTHKASFDKNTTDEKRAKAQLMKLQVVLNEVEVKVQEYHIPTIANTYLDDLVEGRERIARIKTLLAEIPLDIDELNRTLDEAIDFIYKFYNNVNNVVGMAIMVENAIVFGNKYRSSFPEVERDLSKAEFSYLNGEYTKALTMAISCMEKLFPNKMDAKYLENN